ncbi:MAG: hypothetical protein RLZZ532_2669 [Cyanobacteriota bacterium]
MISKEYNDNEEMFLNAIADQWGFKDRCKLVFVQRFLGSNDDLANNALADVLKENLSLDKLKEIDNGLEKEKFSEENS